MLYFSNYCNILMKVGELMFYKENTDHEITRSEGGGLMPQMHEHSYYELYYLEAGSREYFVEDTIFSVEAGDFVLIAPGKLHRTGGEYGMRVLVCFTEDFILRTFTRSAAQRLLACFDDLKLTPGKHRRELFISLLQRIESAADETEFALQLGALLQELNRCEKAEVSGEPVSAIVAYINANFAAIQNIGQIAERFYISKYHLCRVFKEAMKVTVIDYLNQVRIQNACRYLSSSGKDMGEIALLCGFHDAAYFSNVFKRLVGTTPSAYRKGV